MGYVKNSYFALAADWNHPKHTPLNVGMPCNKPIYSNRSKWPTDLKANTNIPDPNPHEGIVDCNGKCVSKVVFDYYVSGTREPWCDDGYFGPNLACEALNWDNGDCATGETMQWTGVELDALGDDSIKEFYCDWYPEWQFSAVAIFNEQDSSYEGATYEPEEGRLEVEYTLEWGPDKDHMTKTIVDTRRETTAPFALRVNDKMNLKPTKIKQTGVYKITVQPLYNGVSEGCLGLVQYFATGDQEWCGVQALCDGVTVMCDSVATSLRGKGSH